MVCCLGGNVASVYCRDKPTEEDPLRQGRGTGRPWQVLRDHRARASRFIEKLLELINSGQLK